MSALHVKQAWWKFTLSSSGGVIYKTIRKVPRPESIPTIQPIQDFFRLLVSRWREVYSFEDLKFKISEDYKQNWSFPVSALLAVSV